jgi:SAM-dependent methyltransferase
MNIELHNVEIQQNRLRWQKKPVLREAYGQFYSEIASRLDARMPGQTVELGSGIGVAKNYIPGCITTDLFANPWVDRVENAYAMTFPDQSIRNLILFDVWHHLEYPGSALREFSRVLVRGGRAILFEPAMSALGRIVYGWFHREPTGLRDDIIGLCPVGIEPSQLGYYAAQGNCWRLFRLQIMPDMLAGWEIREIAYFPALAYVLSGGFSGPQLLPTALLNFMLKHARQSHFFPQLLATRMLVVLEKTI